MGLTDFTSREHLKLTTIEYTIEEDGNFVAEPIVELFCRDANGNRRLIEVEGFYPSFFVSEDEYKQHEKDLFTDSRVRSIIVRESVTSDENINNADLTEEKLAPRTTLNGDRLVKIETVKPSHVGELRDDTFDETWEADVFFTNRFLIESGIKLGLSIPRGKSRVKYDEIEPSNDPDELPDVKPRVLTIDIEVWSGDEFPDTQEALKPITAVTVHDSYDDEYYASILHPSVANIQGGQPYDDYSWSDTTWKLPENVDDCPVDVYMDEAEMLGAVNDWIVEKSPDLISGWNSSSNSMGSGFDYPYWISRCERIGEISYRDLAYENGNVFVTSRGAPVVGGRETFDMLQAYKKTQIHEKRSYALNYIAEDELGYGKEDIEDLDEGWLHEPSDFMQYNIRDVEAVVQIEQVKSVLEMYDHIRSVAGATYSEIADSNIGIIDILYLREAKKRGYALPTSTRPDVQHYWGAYVFDPVPGKHTNVVYPDLKCFAPDHDVMTVDGIKKITEVELGDDVYSINPDTGSVEIKPVVETHAYPDYDGDLVTFSGQRIGFSVTPNHRMLYQDDEEYYFETAGEHGSRSVLPNAQAGVDGDGIDVFDVTDYLDVSSFDVCSEYSEHGHAFRRNLPDGCEKKRANYHKGFFFDGETFKKYQNEIEFLSTNVSLSHPSGVGSKFRPYKFDGDAFIEFLGWFIAEGSVYRPEGDTQTATVQIVQQNEPEAIEHLFTELGIEFSETDGAYTFGSEIYGTFFEEYTGEDSFSKKIPEFIFKRASLQQKKLLLETLIRGDGHRNVYYTSSEELAEDVSRLAVECGKKPNVRERRETEYEITISETNDALNEYQKEIENSTNGVYCVEVADNNTLMAGRDKKFQWCGNSLYPNLFRDMNASPETIVGYADDLEESEYSKDDCHTVYVDERDEETKKKVDEPERAEMYVLKPEVKTSFVRDVIDELIQLKYKFKSDEYSDKAYEAVKRITNSTYGCMADSVSYGVGFRLFDWRIAEAITLAGRDVIKHTANEFEQYVKENGYPSSEIVSGDTDAAVCEIPEADGSWDNSPLSDKEKTVFFEENEELQGHEDTEMAETLAIAIEAAEYTDSTYSDFMYNRFGIEDGSMEVEIESYASSALFMEKKKRYAQWIRWDEGDLKDKVEYKGFELVRSDSTEVTEDAQSEVLDLILKNDDPKPLVKEHVLETWDNVTSGDVSLDEIGRPSAINNDLWSYGYSKDGDRYNYYTPQPRIRGARYANEYIDGENIASGKPLMFYIDSIQAASGLPETYDYENKLKADDDNPRLVERDRRVDAISVEDTRNLPDEVNVDWDKMAEKSVRDPIEPITDVMDWNFDDLIVEGKQSGLEAFM